MKQQRNTQSAPQAALVHALTQCLNSAFASNEITAFDIRDALDLAWQRAWDTARNAPEPQAPESPITSTRIRFTRKPCDFAEALATAPYGDLVTDILIQSSVALSEAEYDAFTDRLLADWCVLAGLGGYTENGKRCVVEITAPNRTTLYVDPSGGSYARYVGIREEDIDAANV